ILEKGSPMPVVPEIRAVWDALRGPYQSVLGGELSPEAAAAKAQGLAVSQIRAMNEVILPGVGTKVLNGALILFGIASLYVFFRAVRRVVLGLMGEQRVAYAFLLPGMLAIL